MHTFISEGYIHKESIQDVSSCIDLFKEGYCYSNIDNPVSFFAELHDYCVKYKNQKRKFHKNVEAVLLTVMIPQNLTTDTQRMNFCKKFILTALMNLPCVAWFSRSGKEGHYMNFLVSERRYCKDEYLEIRQKSDLYKRKGDNGGTVICKKDDEGAVLVHKKGTLHKKIKVHFTKKSRLFSGSDREFQHKMATLKRIVMTILSSMNFKQCFVHFNRVNYKKGKSRTQVQNIISFNNALAYIESTLNNGEYSLRQGYMEDSLIDFNKIKFRYAQRIRNMRFKHNTISLSIAWNKRKDLFQDNIETFLNDFNKEIEEFWMKFI